MTPDDVFEQFTSQVSLDQLRADIGQFWDSVGAGGLPKTTSDWGGIVGLWVRKQLLAQDVPTRYHPADFKALVRRIVAFYKIPEDWIPPGPVIREALALAVQIRNVLGKLPSKYPHKTVLERLLTRIEPYPTADMVFQIPYAEIVSITEGVLK